MSKWRIYIARTLYSISNKQRLQSSSLNRCLLLRMSPQCVQHFLLINIAAALFFLSKNPVYSTRKPMWLLIYNFKIYMAVFHTPLLAYDETGSHGVVITYSLHLIRVSCLVWYNAKPPPPVEEVIFTSLQCSMYNYNIFRLFRITDACAFFQNFPKNVISPTPTVS